MESDEVLQYLESSLTGLTSIEAQKPQAEYGLNAIPEKQKHSLLLIRGRGKRVVVATGLETEIGRIAGLLQGEAGVKTPLQVRLIRFGRISAPTRPAHSPRTG